MESWNEGLEAFYEENWEVAKSCFYHANVRLILFRI